MCDNQRPLERLNYGLLFFFTSSASYSDFYASFTVGYNFYDRKIYNALRERETRSTFYGSIFFFLRFPSSSRSMLRFVLI